ncbi:uncharacterized protein [Amphiura filiformis]|uniref:uncharacterized protein n=1 Tax=Amphiura filiformis TaxID=82378 RepID=UPI003B224EEC
MSSEKGDSSRDPDVPSSDFLQHPSKLVRSASDNCNLALCWAIGQSISKTNTSSAAEEAKPSQKRCNLSGSISLQEIASVVSNTASLHVCSEVKSSTHQSQTTKSNSPPIATNCPPVYSTAGASCLKQTDIQIPSTVFEEKATSEVIIAKDEMNQTASNKTELASKESSDDKDQVFFFWNQEEAEEKQVEQIGASACGATAILNVMNVLDLKPDLRTVASAVKTFQRAEDAPLPEYLFSRSVAGVTHEGLIQGLEKATNDSVYARFFAFYPKRKVDIREWLVSWMRLGIVPLATLNLQAIPVNEDGDIHDAWHHQMIYGVDDDGIHMCNPIIAETIDRIQLQLCSESVLLVRRFDVLKRWHKNTNLSALALHEDARWRDLDVLGQAVDMLLDDPPNKPNSENSDGDDDSRYEKELTDWFMRSHISIPAAYTSGITLIVRKDNEKGYHKLREACELPLDD